MKTTTEPESRKSESEERRPAAPTGAKRPEDKLDPDFPIEETGGPIDGGGDPNTRPVQPPKK